MPTALFFAFACWIITCLSVWIYHDKKIWGLLLTLTLFSTFFAGLINPIGLFLTAGLGALWLYYTQKQTHLLFGLIILASAFFKMHLVPGFTSFTFSPRFALSFEPALIGMFPIALLVSLAQTFADWKAGFKGLAFGAAGIALLAIIATAIGATHWDFKLPTFAALRLLSNLFFSCIPEEAFYRGFLQNTLCSYLKNIRFGKILALLITSLLFTITHIYWSPNLEILAFVFFASLLYGGVYLISGKIESAILTHFLLNFIHMTFFSYHAM